MAMNNSITQLAAVLAGAFLVTTIVLGIKYVKVQHNLNVLQQENVVKIYEVYTDNDTIPDIWFGYNGHDYIAVHDVDCWCNSK